MPSSPDDLYIEMLRVQCESLEAEVRQLSEHNEMMQENERRMQDAGDRYAAALRQIVERPLVELNPDGVDQAAATMQWIARETLGI